MDYKSHKIFMLFISQFFLKKSLIEEGQSFLCSVITLIPYRMKMYTEITITLSWRWIFYATIKQQRLVQNFMLVQKFVVTNWQVKLTPVLKLFSTFLNEKLSSPFTKLHHSFADIHTNQLHTIVNKNC